MRHFVIATAGHVDHGKSALVKALTGTDPDRLPEEKARAITIELGFAHFDLAGPAGENLRVGIIDVPGHEDFVRNMIAGVGSIDLALLIVAADDGWMPQTEEHLQILIHLGVRRGVVALTKADIGDPTKVTDEIRSQLKGSVLELAPIVSTSARSGAGLNDLKRAIAAMLARSPDPENVGKPRLFIDRAFTLHGIGTVATGTLGGGCLKSGETIFLQPRGFEARIRSLQSYSESVEVARPGMRAALNLPDIQIGPGDRGIERGHIATASKLASSDTLDVLIQRSNRPGEKEAAARALKNGIILDLHHGTARIAAKILLLELDLVRRGQEAIAQLRLESPVCAFLGDRLVLRDRSQQCTLAGAVVLDPDGRRATFRSEAQKTFLKARAKCAPPLTDLIGQLGNSSSSFQLLERFIVSAIERDGTVLVRGLLEKSPFSAAQISESLNRLAGAGQVVARGEVAASTRHWQSLKDKAANMVGETHTTNPERPGLELRTLRAAFAHESAEVFDALLADLSNDGFVQKGEVVARGSHQAALPARLAEFASKILQTLSEKAFDPPPLSQLAPAGGAREALKFLIQTGAVVEISSDLVLRREDFEHAKSVIEEFITKNGPATASALRQELGTSRRVIIPLLERLDRDGLTRRTGDQRVLAAN